MKKYRIDIIGTTEHSITYFDTEFEAGVFAGKAKHSMTIEGIEAGIFLLKGIEASKNSDGKYNCYDIIAMVE